MKSRFLAAIILFLGLAFINSTVAQEKESVKKPEKKVEKTEMKDRYDKDEVKEIKEVKKDIVTEEGVPFNTICPVSTEEADPNITYTYEGKTYALCCNSCLKKFKKDPEKYISRLSEDGKSIKKKK
jgi:YHS domain-containing protein